jgi:DNA-binding response OmpR family regulator
VDSLAKTRSRVLVIDDSATIQNVAKKVLTRAGYDVDVAEDWLTANKVFHAPGQPPPDVVLIDVNLGTSMRGNMNLDAYLKWREKGNRKRPGLFLFSEMPEPELAALAKECSADGYIFKGPGLAGMVPAIQSFLEANP